MMHIKNATFDNVPYTMCNMTRLGRLNNFKIFALVRNYVGLIQCELGHPHHSPSGRKIFVYRKAEKKMKGKIGRGKKHMRNWRHFYFS